MVDGQKSIDADISKRRWLFIAACILPLAIAAALFALFSITVQADVPLAATTSGLPAAASTEGVPAPPAIRLEFAGPIKQVRGIASWYGASFDGRTTANGEIFDMKALTACSNALPFESVVRVVNLRNRRSVMVRINDRGLLFPGRVIDLSYAAAERLDMMRSGVAPVRLDVLSLGSNRRAK